MSSTLIEKIIKQLQVKQKPWNPTKFEKPNLQPFSVEFNYLGRSLHRLNDNFKDFKIMDLHKPSFGNAALYCLMGRDVCRSVLSSSEIADAMNNPQKICDLLGINALVVGPDEEQVTIWITENCSSPPPYIILFHSYDDLYYPIISLEKRSDYVFYRQNNIILQEYLPESEE